ncbi:sigma-70 family RNA polymerase sigma factor [Pseudonocardia sp. CA-107938]|uniref:sigma-70 family RNA polymerase sigma factor n=1 Tax=Pseudonocardia sp. CA-107938 TaxID=3240021 RepID=UPI003D91A332
MERFIRATQHDVLRFVAHLYDRASAEDLAQETYLRALGSLHRFEGRSPALVWLLSIARRTVADHIRAVRIRPRSVDLPEWESVSERAGSTAGPGLDDAIALADLVRSLHRDQREAFVLTQAIGLSYADVAVICRCPIGTVRSRVARAREALITALHERDDQRAGESAS